MTNVGGTRTRSSAQVVVEGKRGGRGLVGPRGSEGLRAGIGQKRKKLWLGWSSDDGAVSEAEGRLSMTTSLTRRRAR